MRFHREKQIKVSHKVKFLFIAICGICLGIFEGSPEHMCLPIMTQAGCEHATQCISLVHADALRIALQTQTTEADLVLLMFLTAY